MKVCESCDDSRACIRCVFDSWLFFWISMIVASLTEVTKKMEAMIQ